ncbi:MAG: glycosyltransferase family 4 protein [Isosphaeraceae bacterium]
MITIGHSYCVALNRRLAHELARVGGAEWEVTTAAPSFLQGDLRPVPLEPDPPGSGPWRLEPVPMHLAKRVHVMLYGRRLRTLLREPWDVVHAWEEPYILAGGQIAWWAPRNAAYLFYTFQNIAKRYPPPFSAVERYCLDRCAGWLAAGESVAVAQRARGYDRKPHRVMHLGVALDRFAPDAAAGEEVRRRLGWAAEGPPVVGFLGRFIAEKGLGLLTRTLDRLKAKTPWRALFVGGGAMEGDLRAWGAGHGDAVRLATDVTHDMVPAYLNAMDLLAAPSQTTPHWREQLGRMLIEAFGCGVPVVASDSGEIPHVVADAGRVVAEADEPAWERTLAELLDSPATREDLRQRGLERARAHYDWPVVARRHLDFFQERLDEPRR